MHIPRRVYNTDLHLVVSWDLVWRYAARQQLRPSYRPRCDPLLR